MFKSLLGKVSKISMLYLCVNSFHKQIYNTQKYETANVDNNCPQSLIKLLINMSIPISQTKKQSNKITLINSVGDSKQFNWLQQDQDIKILLGNFMNPPINCSKQKMYQYLKQLGSDQFITMVYIPQQIFQQVGEFQSFKKSQIPNLMKIKQQFKLLKYSSLTNKNLFVTISDAKLAQEMNLNTKKPGIIQIYSKATLHAPANGSLQGIRYNINKINESQLLAQRKTINSITTKGIKYINSQNDLYNLIRQIQIGMKEHRILLVHSNQKQEAINRNIDQILSKIAKVMHRQIVIVKSQSNSLLKKFNIYADQKTTIRLINPHQLQQPIHINGVNKKRRVYSRSKFQKDFQYEKIYNWINSQQQEYYESIKTLERLNKLLPGEFQDKKKMVVMYVMDGCAGCQFLGKKLLMIKKIVDQIKDKSALNDQIRVKYQIQNPQLLKSTQFYTYNILNEDPKHPSPMRTPTLQLCLQGECKIINYQDIFANRKQIKKYDSQKFQHQILVSLIDKISKSISNDQI